jgi:hypothetical protein
VFIIKPEPPKKKPPTINEEGEEVPAVEDEIDEETMAELMKPKFQKQIYPDSVIFIRGEDSFVKSRAKKLDHDAAGFKWSHENIDRRIKKFHANNDLDLFVQANNHKDLGLPSFKQPMLPITRFFQENKTEVFEIDGDGNLFEMLESMRVYVERNGRPYNYLSSVRNLNQKRIEHLHDEEKDAIKTEEDMDAAEKLAQKQKRDALESLANNRIEALVAH